MANQINNLIDILEKLNEASVSLHDSELQKRQEQEKKFAKYRESVELNLAKKKKKETEEEFKTRLSKLKQTDAFQKKVNKEYEKAQNLVSRNEAKQKELQYLQDLNYITELKKEQFQTESELYKTKLLNATKLGKVVSANGKSMAENIVGAAKKGLDAVGGSVEKYLDTYTQYMGTVSARIQGAGYEYSDLIDKIRDNTAANPYIRTTNMLGTLNKLVEAGINDNLMQRAFLEEISDRIATTFDATQSSLLRIVRIQQQDTTASRLGMEAYLTRMFNNYFGDTSYLSNQFDAVQETLTAVSSQLTAEASVEFEYIVQKWLGSLGSVGVSDGTLSKLAEGISYIGSGNITALQNDEALQNLFVMAANRAGLNYTDMLVNGISSNQANSLMQAVVEYIKSISTSSNNVLKSQYAELFGVTLTDMQAFHNLNDNIIDEIYASAMTYTNTLDELQYQLNEVSKRTHVSEMINNIFDNTLAGIGMNVANNTGLYITYKAADMLEKLTGGINLPFISALGNGIDLNMSLEGLIKGGVLGISTIGQLFAAIGSLTAGGGINLDNWTVESNKGQGFAGYRNAGDLIETRSSVSYASNTNSTGMQQSLVDQQKQASKEVMGTDNSSENREETKCSNIAAILKILQNVTSGNALNVSIEGAAGIDFAL